VGGGRGPLKTSEKINKKKTTYKSKTETRYAEGREEPRKKTSLC
jgi:hypothetical protein